MRTLSCIILFGLTACTMTGCGTGRESADVTGSVTRQGLAVAGMVVRFQPTGDSANSRKQPGMGSFGVTDSSGRFQLQFSDDGLAGAAIGDHFVTVDHLETGGSSVDDRDAGDISAPDSSIIPATWSRGTQVLTVVPGDNDFEIRLDE